MSVEVTTSLVLDLYRPLHAKIREALAGLDSVALNWRPGPETNSIGALVQHIVNTEQGNVARITGAASERILWDESRTFETAELLQLLDQADAFLDETAHSMPAEQLAKQVTHPHRGPSSALILLLQTYGHVNEHFGHLELTRQLCLQNVPAGKRD